MNRYLIGLLLILGIGCGPIQSTQGIIGAEHTLKEAKLQNAIKRAPYEYTKADIYLKIAKQRQMRSEFEAAINFATESEDWGEKALKTTDNPRLLKLRMKYDPEYRRIIKNLEKKAKNKKEETK